MESQLGCAYCNASDLMQSAQLLIKVLTLGAPLGVIPEILLITGAAPVHTHHPSEAGRSSPAPSGPTLQIIRPLEHTRLLPMQACQPPPQLAARGCVALGVYGSAVCVHRSVISLSSCSLAVTPGTQDSSPFLGCGSLETLVLLFKSSVLTSQR